MDINTFACGMQGIFLVDRNFLRIVDEKYISFRRKKCNGGGFFTYMRVDF